MEKKLGWRFATCAILTILTFVFLVPTFYSLKNPDAEGKLPGWMPNTSMRLGLDLQGGVHMVLGVDLDKVVVNQLTAYGRDLEKTLDGKNVKGAKFKVNEARLELEGTFASKADVQTADNFVSSEYTVLQAVGATDNVGVFRMAPTQEEYVRARAIDQSIETIRNRIDEFGVAEPIISRKGDNQVLVQFPGAKEPERLKDLIGQTAQLYFRIAHECRDGGCLAKWESDLSAWIKEAEEKGAYKRESFQRFSDYRKKINEDLAAKLPPETAIYFERTRDVNNPSETSYRPFLLSTKNTLSGEYIQNASVRMSESGGLRVGAARPEVAFEMNPAGAPLLGALTGDHQGMFMAIVLDDFVKSAPSINSAIREAGIITLGSGSIDEMQKEAQDLAVVLRAGALPASIEIQEERVIGPSLGRDAIEAGNLALALSALMVCVLLVLYYGSAGLVAAFVTIMNVGFIIAVLGVMGATLTLPGIAGIVLTLGMAVDALILIYERMREEIRAGRSRTQVLELGFEHATTAILDSNVTTAIGAFVLLQYGTGSIRGFALTLMVGILANVFMATFYTKTLFQGLLKWGLMKELRVGLNGKDLKEAAV